MKYCPKCGTVLQDDVNFCPICGTAQNPAATPSPAPVPEVPASSGNATLTALCILTILGSVSGILKGMFYDAFARMTREFTGTTYYMFGYLMAIANVGTLAGAIMMLNRKKAGYATYAISQIACIAIIIIRTLVFSMDVSDNTDIFGRSYSHSFNHSFGAFSLFIGSFSAIPAIVFLILYTTLVKKQLK